MFLRKARRSFVPAILLVGALALPASLPAGTISWNAGNGNWSVATNWSPQQVPGAGDTVNFYSTAAAGTTITYDYAGLAVTLNSLNIGLSGGHPAAANTLNMPGNNLLTATFENIGTNGLGMLVQSNGTNTVNQTLSVGDTSTGTYTLSGTGTLSAGDEYVGNGAAGTFTQNGGTNTLSGYLILGNLILGHPSGGTGTYNLTGGTLDVGDRDEIIGAGATGAFTQSGGANSLDFLVIGNSSTGTYALSGTGTLSTGAEFVGWDGMGTFTQSGGTNTVSGRLSVAATQWAGGTYNLTGGTLNASGVSAIENVGAGGTGAFTHSGGTNNASTLSVGDTSTGTYTLSGTGTLSAGTEYVGNSATGTFTQNRGTNTLSGNLFLGSNSGVTGTYNLSGGTLNVANFFGAYEYVGDAGAGTFTQNGGTNNAWALLLGNQGSAVGTYTLSGTGALNAAEEFVGGYGAGTFTQNGGTNTVSGFLSVGRASGSTSTYNLTGGTLNVSDAGEFVGSASAGTFTQNGGTNNVRNLYLGNMGASVGTYTLSGTGALNASAEYVGYGTRGTFTQSGGTNTVSGSLIVGGYIGATGTYNLTGGWASVGGSLEVGGAGGAAGGTGVLSVSGTGTLTAGTLVAYNTPGTQIELTGGGTINAGALNFNGVPSLLNWHDGGTLNLTSDVTFDSAAAATSTSAAFGPALTLDYGQILQVTGNETLGGAGAFSLTLNDGGLHYVTGNITLNPSGTFTQNGGEIFYNNFTQAGGAVNGELLNEGNFIYQSGQFNGRLINEGTVSLGPRFTAIGIENDTSMTVSAGQILTLNGAAEWGLPGLDNFGTLTLAGGTILSDSGVVNEFGAVINVSASRVSTINTGFSNYGQVTVSGRLTLSQGGTNYGTLTLQTGGSITAGREMLFVNDGSGAIQGSGVINDNFNNYGAMTIGAGNTLTVSSSWSNYGLVSMQGGTLGGGGLENEGTIQGTGLVRQSVLNDMGTIRASGGELDIGGSSSSTNYYQGQIQASTGNTVMFIQGLGTNEGTIALSGGAFDNNNLSLNNYGSILGNGTVRTGGLLNQGDIFFSDAPTSVYGSLYTSSYFGHGNVQVTDNTTTFYGPVTVGDGTSIIASQATLRFLAGVTDYGTIISDPSTQIYTNLTIEPTGALIGSAGDVYEFSGNLTNESTQADTFDVSQAEFEFIGSGDHTLAWSGVDMGSTTGYVDNFAMGTLELTTGNWLTLSDGGVNRTSAGLYVGTLLLDAALHDTAAQLEAFLLANLIEGNSHDVLNIYYDPLMPGNQYLQDMKFSLGNGGFLEPYAAPEPSTMGMVLVAAACACLARRRRYLG